MTEVSANPSSGVNAENSTVTATNAEPVVNSSSAPDPVQAASVASVTAPVSEAAPSTTTEPAKESPATLSDADKELSLLSADEPAKEETKTEEKPAEEAEKEVSSQSDEPAPLPTYEAFKIPEDIKLDDERLSDFTKTLGEFEVATKASHDEVQKLGQSLVDRHLSEVQGALTRQMDSINKYWKDKKTEWVNEFKSDPDLGGKRYDTSISEAKEFLRTHLPTDRLAAFYSALKETGMEAHPEMIRALISIKNSSTFKTPQQLTASKPVAENKSKIARRYGSTS